ncbi:hypothetical protein Patl1_28154 [Pistacia atlantica]|uniref:Uncharacterized protein n=1 Tax=Pistacia atlantica TaxID=434234 RepID=A0ACC1BG27_9ROSI|nr:hypothetical protein Patl1_28154 [Pistacia atlantica]
MASSSSLKKRLSLVGQGGILGEVEEEEEEEEEEKRDWLQLGLGLGFGLNTSGKKKQEHYQSKENPVSVSPTVLPSPSPTLPGVQHHQEIGLGLGLELGLGFDNGSMCYKDVAPISNNNQKKLWEDLDQGGQYCDDEDHDLDYDDEDIPSGSCLDWQNPKFNDSHHISSRRRPHPGLWFTLISFTNRVGQALPQIPKAYIRVKDENMTVFTVKKYLVRKLGLSNEAEVIYSNLSLPLSIMKHA